MQYFFAYLKKKMDSETSLIGNFQDISVKNTHTEWKFGDLYSPPCSNWSVETRQRGGPLLRTKKYRNRARLQGQGRHQPAPFLCTKARAPVVIPCNDGACAVHTAYDRAVHSAPLVLACGAVGVACSRTRTVVTNVLPPRVPRVRRVPAEV